MLLGNKNNGKSDGENGRRGEKGRERASARRDRQSKYIRLRDGSENAASV